MGRPSPESPPKRKSWLKRIFAFLAIFIVLIVLFHRPILRFSIGWAGVHFAEKAGLTLNWQVNGTILSSLLLGNVTVTGDETSVVKKIEWGRASADYSIRDYFKGGLGSVLRGFELENANIELDLRPRPDAPEKKPKEPKPPGNPPDFWIGHLELRNINAKLTTEQGDILLKGLTFLLDEKKPGVLTIEELIIPSSNLHFQNVTGKTEVNDRTITISDLQIMPDVSIPKLVLGVKELKNGTATFHLEVASGESTIAAAGKLDGIGKDLAVDATLAIQRLVPAEISRWAKMPENMAWKLNQANVRVKGPVAEPQKLFTELTAEVTEIAANQVKADRVSLAAKMDAGALKVSTLTLNAGSNNITISADAALPPTWPEMKNLSANAVWKLDAPVLETLWAGPPTILGALQGNGTFELINGKVGPGLASLQATELRINDLSIASIQSEITTNAETVQVESLVVKVDEQNVARLNGKMNLAAPQPAEVRWQIETPNLASLLDRLNVKNIARPKAGLLTSEGSASFTIADLQAKKYDAAIAQATVELDGLDWEGKPLKNALLKASVKDGKAQVTQFDVRIDDQNSLSANVDVLLTDRMPLELTWKADVTNLASLASWAGLANLPPPSAGVVKTQGTLKTNVIDLQERKFQTLEAQTTLRLAGLIWQNGKLESLDLNANVHEGSANLENLTLRLNERNNLVAKAQLKLDESSDFTAELDGALEKLSDFAGWMELAKAPKITDGSATLAWKGSGKVSSRDIIGNGTIGVKNLRIEGQPDAYSLALETSHEGRRAEVKRLEATVGKIFATANAVITDTAISMPKLAVSSGDLSLIQGSLEIPIDLAQTPKPAVPIDPKRPLNVQLKMDKIDFTKLFAIIGKKPPVAGNVSMDLDVHGLLPQLEGKLNVELAKISAEQTKGKLEPASVKLSAILSGNRLNAELNVDQKPLKTLQAKADLPLDASKVLANPAALQDAPLNATVTLPNSDLSVAKRFAPIIDQIKGQVGLDVKLSGPLRGPQWQGQLIADVPFATFNSLQLPEVKDFKTRISFAGHRINIDDFSTTLAGGQVRLSGNADVTELANPKFDLKLEATEALLVRDDTMSVRANALITCKGALAKADIAGRVDLVRGRVFKEIEFLPLSLPNQLPPPPPASRRSNVSQTKLPPPFDQWTFNIDIRTKDQIRMLGNVLNGGIVVNLKASGTGAAPALEGRVDLDGARLRLPFSRLAISRGTILFTKEKLFEPDLDLQGDSIVGNYEVNVYATGPALSPQIRMTSSPPLSEGDIATLLATGSTAGDLRSSEGVAANRAVYLLVSQLYRKVFRKAQPMKYDEDPPRLSFNFSLLSTGSSQRNVSAVYEINPKLQAIGTVGERGTFRGLLYYLVRFR